MPQLVVCHGCCCVLYEGEELKPPYEIVEHFEGRCPHCGKKLSYVPKNIEIKLASEPRA